MARKPSSPGKARDAKTGHYVTKGYAKKHPSTTVVEHDGPKSRRKKGK